jgi:mRNA interferase MazF
MKQQIGDYLSAKSFGRKNAYIPDQGDIIWADFDNPPVGHEQGYRRRAVVVSPMSINKLTSKAIVFPITTKVKNYKFEVLLPIGMNTKGVILSGDIKTIDCRARNIELVEKAPLDLIKKVAESFLDLFPILNDILDDTSLLH